jgi:hypothetical protein
MKSRIFEVQQRGKLDDSDLRLQSYYGEREILYTEA